MIQYPDELPSDAVESLVIMISTKTFEKTSFMLAVWNLEGYALSKLGSFKIYGGGPTHPISDDEALDSLRSLQTAPGTVGGMVPDFILKTILTWALRKALEVL